MRTVEFLDDLLLRKARAAVEARGAAQRAGIRRLFDAALRRARAAAALSNDAQIPVSLELFSRAGGCYAAAVLLSRDPSFAPGGLDPVALFAKLDDLVDDGSLQPPPDGYRAARAILIENQPFAFDELPKANAIAAREIVEPTIQWLHDLVEPRTAPELRRAGVVRIARGIAALMAGVCLLVWLAVLAIRPNNLALHKAVTASSETPGAPKPEGVTNGDIEPTYGVVTANEPNPWVRVDLGELFRISSVTVHQRGDGHFAQGFPMTIELSANDNDWIEIGRRDAASAADWTVPTKRRARFVRVRSIGTKLLALTEIEVLGRK